MNYGHPKPHYKKFRFFSIITIFSAEILKHPDKEVRIDGIKLSESANGQNRFFQSTDVMGENTVPDRYYFNGPDDIRYTGMGL
jgi:hypothetical protein